MAYDERNLPTRVSVLESQFKRMSEDHTATLISLAELREGQRRSDKFTWMAMGVLAAVQFFLRYATH